MNIVKNSPHSKPKPGMTCLCTWEPIDESCYVEYQSKPSMKWSVCLFGEEAVRQLLQTQYQIYIDSVQKTDCIKEFTRLMKVGPPIWITDKHGLPLPEGDTHVHKLWFMNDNTEISGKLHGALEGKERLELWENMKAFSPQVKTTSH